MKEIYICHQYGDPTHTRALYMCQALYDYEIKQYIILDMKALFLKAVRKIVKEKEFLHGCYELAVGCINRYRLFFLKNKILIVGLAPYDSLMMKYQRVFKKNYSIYHTSHTVWDGTYFPRGTLKNKEKFENCLKENFQAVACISRTSYEQISDWFLYAEIVNHSIDIENYVSRQEYEKTRVDYIFIGSLCERKNINLILEFAEKNRNSNITITFVGAGKLSKKVQRIANKDPRIRYLGKWTKDEIKENLHKFHFLILPSYEEPFGIVILEALAAGIPSIVSNVSGPMEIIRHEENGFVFELDEDTAFDKIMERTYEMHEEEYKKMCEQALQDSKKYSDKNIASKWMNLIRES